jgi:hypothetical protein
MPSDFARFGEAVAIAGYNIVISNPGADINGTDDGIANLKVLGAASPISRVALPAIDLALEKKDVSSGARLLRFSA